MTLHSATVIAAGEDRFVALVSEDDLEGDDIIVVLNSIVGNKLTTYDRNQSELLKGI